MRGVSIDLSSDILVTYKHLGTFLFIFSLILYLS